MSLKLLNYLSEGSGSLAPPKEDEAKVTVP
jgi:hypothetical protein